MEKKRLQPLYIVGNIENGKFKQVPNWGTLRMENSSKFQTGADIQETGFIPEVKML